MNLFAILLFVLLAIDLIWGFVLIGGGSRLVRQTTRVQKGSALVVNSFFYALIALGALGYL